MKYAYFSRTSSLGSRPGDGGRRRAGDRRGRPGRTLSAIAPRQHEHRKTAAARLTAVANTGLLPAELEEMSLYYRAKAERDLGGREAAAAVGDQLHALAGGCGAATELALQYGDLMAQSKDLRGV
ncbi:hypothetical protein [Streptomyces mirabilis]|uniref:hypothetical protein n=1 Tax=Streptomyces mirabilis TaxID=68239 RepID=UPI0033B57FEE